MIAKLNLWPIPINLRSVQAVPATSMGGITMGDLKSYRVQSALSERARRAREAQQLLERTRLKRASSKAWNWSPASTIIMVW